MALSVTNSGNPVWGRVFDRAKSANPFQPGGMEATGGPREVATPGVMTVSGSINASFILLGLCGAGFVAGWSLLPANWMYPVLIAGGIPGFILAVVLMFKPLAAPVIAPIYAVLQGLFLGAVSLVVDTALGNTKLAASLGGSLAAAAGIMTLAVFAGMLIAYKTGLIRATAKFQAVMKVALIGVLLFLGATLVASLFGVALVRVGSPLGIGIAVVIGLIAAFTLILDFAFIDQGAQMGLPKQMEWYGAFGLLATLIWLYISILRILIEIAAASRK